MDRRSYLSILAVGAMAASGCASTGQPAATATRTLTPVSVNEADVSADDPVTTLEVEYSATVANELPTDPPTLAEDGQKWVLLRMRITNEGAETYDVTGGPFILEHNGQTYEIVSTGADWSVRGRTIEPGDSTTGWLVYHLPEAATSAMLTVRDDISRSYKVTFTRSIDLGTSLPD